MMEEMAMSTAELIPETAARKPRLALMGEFSAGKSTLSNMLLGGAPLPVRITATRLPPIWISHGADRAVAVGHDGAERALDIAELDEVSLADTRVIRLQTEADTLEICDLIDMPGISDPNMSSDVWMSMIREVDSVVWCTHATQAWRQSEAAVWEQIAGGTNGRNLLLITQMDKLRNARDRSRVLKRVKKEAGDLFEAIYPVSLTEALAAEEDAGLWDASGAAAFVEHLVDLLLNAPLAAGTEPYRSAPAGHDPFDRLTGQAEDPSARAGVVLTAVENPSGPDLTADAAPAIMPRRVQAPSDNPRRSARPGRSGPPGHGDD